jgi:hypothetical protein
MEILKEITVWNTDYSVCNHTYLLDKSGGIIAYVRDGTGEVIISKSRIKIDKRYRKFIKDNHPALSKIMAQTKEDKEPENNKPVKNDNVRIFKVKSGDKEYFVEYNKSYKTFSCNCVGYGFRRKCKHVDAVKENIK